MFKSASGRGYVSSLNGRGNFRSSKILFQRLFSHADDLDAAVAAVNGSSNVAPSVEDAAHCHRIFDCLPFKTKK